MDFELCTDNLADINWANEFNFKRIELCSALEIGGLTPSAALISEACAIAKPEVHVMVRARGGNFCYNETEIALMKSEVRMASAGGAKGVVFGALKDDGRLDLQSTIEIVEMAKKYDMEFTYHRAIDLAADPVEVTKHLINIGVDRILTSGGYPSAFEGIDKIREMVEIANRRIEIMAGAGVNAENCLKLSETGVDALHFTARKAKDETPLSMGTNYATDIEKMKNIIWQF